MKPVRIRLSRPAKTARNLLLAALALLLWRGFLGFPAFTPMGAFRQCERRQMVGPAEALDCLRIRNGRERLILAQDGDILEAAEVSRRGLWAWEAHWMIRAPLDGQVQAIPLLWEDEQNTTLLFAVAVPPEANWAEGTMLYDPKGLAISLQFSGDRRVGDFIIARAQRAENGETAALVSDFQRLRDENDGWRRLDYQISVKTARRPD